MKSFASILRLEIIPTKDFEVKYYKSLKLAHNNHIYISSDKHHYSVPYTHIGEQTRVIYTRSIVRIFAQDGQLIAVHPRSFKKSGYTARKEHLCSHHQYYKKRSPSYYMQEGMTTLKSSTSISTRCSNRINTQNNFTEVVKGY